VLGNRANELGASEDLFGWPMTIKWCGKIEKEASGFDGRRLHFRTTERIREQTKIDHRQIHRSSFATLES